MKRPLARELTIGEISFQRQPTVPLIYKGVKLDCGYRLDFLIEDLVMVELKSVEGFMPIPKAQALTYLRLMSGKPSHLSTMVRGKLCILINFNVPVVCPERLACSAGVSPAMVIARSHVAWIARLRETKTLKPIDKGIFRMVNESPGRNESERIGGPEN